jgi:hypothetical protein
MAWTITWRPGIRERFESLLGDIGPEASNCVQEGFQGMPVPLPGPGPHSVIILVRGLSLDCGVDPANQTAEVQGVENEEQS